MAQNMIVVILVLMIFLLVWLVFFIKDYLVTFLPRGTRYWWARQHAPWCQNFVLRFFYEFFLEFCICVILQLSVKDLSDFSPTLQFFISIVTIMAILSTVALVTLLFFYGGPWVPGFFIRETALKSAWVEHRIRDPTFKGN